MLLFFFFASVYLGFTVLMMLETKLFLHERRTDFFQGVVVDFSR